MSDDSTGEIVIGDIDDDDCYDPLDERVDWSHVDELARQVDEINSIENEDVKTAAAEQWAAELGGEA